MILGCFTSLFQHLFSQLLEADTLTAIFKGNATLCHRVSESTIHHFINSISKARHVKYLQFLQTIVKCDTYIKRTQDLVMREVGILINISNDSSMIGYI